METYIVSIFIAALKVFDNNIEINEKLDLNIKKQFKTLDTKICDYIILNLEE